jgi:hypothetical protein
VPGQRDTAPLGVQNLRGSGENPTVVGIRAPWTLMRLSSLVVDVRTLRGQFLRATLHTIGGKGSGMTTTAGNQRRRHR